MVIAMRNRFARFLTAMTTRRGSITNTKLTRIMSSHTIDAIWEQSKAQHRADAEAREGMFRRKFEKTWSLLLTPSLYLRLPLLIVPAYRRWFMSERQAVLEAIKVIVTEYVPQIRGALVRWEQGFNRWEEENAGPSRCGSAEATSAETAGRDAAKRLSQVMLEKLGAIPNYKWHFHMIDDPAKMVENPYPGYLTSVRAHNYCDHLVSIFG